MSTVKSTRNKELLTIPVASTTVLLFTCLAFRDLPKAKESLIYLATVFAVLSVFLSDRKGLRLTPGQLYDQIQIRKISMGALEKFYGLGSMVLLGLWIYYRING
jgi:hypothetical protein